jgi:Tol biopolymer transport system component
VVNGPVLSMRVCVGLAGLAVCVAIGAALASSERADATFAGKNGRIYFATDFSTLGSVTPQGNDVRPAVSTEAEDRSPSLSPDGKRLAFTREGGMSDEANQLMVGPVGGVPTPIGGRGLDPVFVGPSGSKLVFEAGKFLEMGENDLTIANVDGSNVETIAKLNFNGPLRPAVSPDGKTIVFQGGNSQTACRLFQIDIDGGHKRALTANSDGAAFNPSFSPDGRSIVFQFGSAPPRKSGDNAQIATMDLKTGEVTTLTSPNKSSSDPVFSPDARKIAFVREGRGLFVMDANGANEQLVLKPKRAGADDIIRIDWAVK